MLLGGLLTTLLGPSVIVRSLDTYCVHSHNSSVILDPLLLSLRRSKTAASYCNLVPQATPADKTKKNKKKKCYKLWQAHAVHQSGLLRLTVMPSCMRK